MPFAPDSVYLVAAPAHRVLPPGAYFLRQKCASITGQTTTPPGDLDSCSAAGHGCEEARRHHHAPARIPDRRPRQPPGARHPRPRTGAGLHGRHAFPFVLRREQISSASPGAGAGRGQYDLGGVVAGCRPAVVRRQDLQAEGGAKTRRGDGLVSARAWTDQRTYRRAETEDRADAAGCRPGAARPAAHRARGRRSELHREGSSPRQNRVRCRAAAPPARALHAQHHRRHPDRACHAPWLDRPRQAGRAGMQPPRRPHRSGALHGSCDQGRAVHLASTAGVVARLGHARTAGACVRSRLAAPAALPRHGEGDRRAKAAWWACGR